MGEGHVSSNCLLVFAVLSPLPARVGGTGPCCLAFPTLGLGFPVSPSQKDPRPFVTLLLLNRGGGGITEGACIVGSVRSMKKGHVDGFTVGLFFWPPAHLWWKGRRTCVVHLLCVPCRALAVSRPGWWHRPVLSGVSHSGVRPTVFPSQKQCAPFSSPFSCGADEGGAIPECGWIVVSWRSSTNNAI